MDNYDDTVLLNKELDQCKDALQEVYNKGLLTDQTGQMLYFLFQDPIIDKITSGEVKAKLIFNTANYLKKLLDSTISDIDPKFIKTFETNNIQRGLFRILKKMNIMTLGDLVKYKNLEDFATDYQHKVRTIDYKSENGSVLPANIERSLKNFMQDEEISWGMGITLSDKLASDQEKMNKLLLLSFDQSVLENRKAMKEFRIENTGGVFTKLFNHGIQNFQVLVSNYTYIKDIEIKGFGEIAKIYLTKIMKHHNLSFGMDITKYK